MDQRDYQISVVQTETTLVKESSSEFSVYDAVYERAEIFMDSYDLNICLPEPDRRPVIALKALTIKKGERSKLFSRFGSAKQTPILQPC